MKRHIIKTLLSLSSIFWTDAFAGKLVIKNDDNSSSVEVIIEPGEGSVFSSTPQIKRILKASEEIKLTVTPESLGKVATFSIIGKVTIPSLYNRCTGLFFDKDYKIVFTPSKTGGIVCHYTELKDESTKEHSKDYDDSDSTKGADKTIKDDSRHNVESR